MNLRTKRYLEEEAERVVTGDAARQRISPRSNEIRVNEALGPRPPWMKVSTPTSGRIESMSAMVDGMKLHTVCESASCPNRGECWSRGTATIMILGNICTRRCGFCGVQTGKPLAVDAEEPRRVAEAVKQMALRYVVVTSVDRDDLPDGGAAIWAETIREMRAACPDMGVEVLIPDFIGKRADQQVVFDARPHVLAHNLETVERMHSTVRPQARYQRSLDVLTHAREAGLIAKSGMMLGIGEEASEVIAAMRDLHKAGCQVLTLGQYLQPSPIHLPIERWVHPAEFESLRQEALAIGFQKCDAGPLVRSSYHAEEVMNDTSPLADVLAKAVGAGVPQA